MARPSDYLLKYYTPINDKMAYKEAVGLKPETPFVGVLYQFIKMLEDFWFSLLGIFKLNREKRTFSQSKFANACKMVFLSITYLFANFFVPVYKFASNKKYYDKVVDKYFSERNIKTKDDHCNRYTNLFKSIAIALLHWISTILESVLNLVRGSLLIIMSIPIIITSPLRYLLPTFNEIDALHGRKISQAIERFINHNVISDKNGGFSQIMDVLLHLKRRISSGHVAVNKPFWEAIANLKTALASNTPLAKVTQQFQTAIRGHVSGDATTHLKPIQSDTLGSEKQLSLSLVNNIADAVSHIDTKLSQAEKKEQLSTLVKTFQVDIQQLSTSI